jgi:phage gp36-like protein
MSFLDLALHFDAREQPREAAWAYELALQEPEPTLSTYCNLVALYFSCTDTGFFSAHHLPMEFVDAAYVRALALLDQAERDLGWDPEIQTWRHHLREQVSAADVDPSVYDRLARYESATLAKLLAHLSSNRHAYQEEARALFSRSERRDTELQRYINSFAPLGLRVDRRG